MPSDSRHYHFVTGKLAAPITQRVVAQVAAANEFSYSIQVLPITVAALITSRWLLRHIEVPKAATHLMVPGYLDGEVALIRERFPHLTVEAGPREIRDLPLVFSGHSRISPELNEYDIEILAEINHADRLTITELVATAERLRSNGADVIDLGCSPGARWSEVGAAVRELKDREFRVSIDSFDANEVEVACKNGAELVLSVNETNSAAAKDWDTEVVAIPNTPDNLASLYRTVDELAKNNVPMRLDPILEPLGCGFADSLLRYAECRRRFQEVPMMMGIGNITELSDVDSAGINLVLLGLCQEWSIHSVLTTQVINWARSSVAECDLARRMVQYACENQTPPKNIANGLVMLRDSRLSQPYEEASLSSMAEQIKDRNIRLFVSGEQVHAVSSSVHVSAKDPFMAMESLLDSEVGPSIDSGHAFYLGFEMAKAAIAMQLGKQYNQDQPLDWGLLTELETYHRLARKRPTEPN